MKHRFAVAEYMHTGNGPAREWVIIATFVRIEDALDFVAMRRLSGRILKTTTN
jgi:hypothetical protein